MAVGGYEMVNPCQNRVRLGSQKKRVRLAAGTILRGYDLTNIPVYHTSCYYNSEFRSILKCLIREFMARPHTTSSSLRFIRR